MQFRDLVGLHMHVNSLFPVATRLLRFPLLSPPGGHDSHLVLLPRELFTNARVFDVGRNEGWVLNHCTLI
jgi:hypothetical protein